MFSSNRSTGRVVVLALGAIAGAGYGISRLPYQLVRRLTPEEVEEYHAQFRAEDLAKGRQPSAMAAEDEQPRLRLRMSETKPLRLTDEAVALVEQVNREHPELQTPKAEDPMATEQSKEIRKLYEREWKWGR
ncbi:uncharacterized protein V1510DRAFT_428596 [Dipodascopsis tothii]|uniref:uncharacterized protein n=1 Tax=Dipodascopsis tothii TaxID=44089 RepID=UPI0034CD5362